MKKSKGILAIVSGFSGAGKGTLMKRLVQQYKNYALSISATTRCPRKGEVEGREYFFKSKEDFELMIEQDLLIEHASYVENYYGTPKAYVNEQLEKGNDVILEIEIQGALKVKKKLPDALLLFVIPPSAKVLKERLVRRGTEDAKTVRARLNRANQEAAYMEAYDYLVVNDDLEACVKKMHGMIQSEHARVTRNVDLIEVMKEELKAIGKEI